MFNFNPYDDFVDFEESKSKIAYLYGPKRSSKTTFLLTLINTYRYYDTSIFVKMLMK